MATLELFRTLRRLVVDGGRLSVADNVALTQARRERERGWLVVDGGRLSVADNVALTQARREREREDGSWWTAGASPSPITSPSHRPPPRPWFR